VTTRARHVTVRWTAPRHGFEHATRPRATRTLCGQVPTPERFGWPSVDGRCPDCQRALDELEGVR
jgi:hypothetical protein